MKIKSLKSLFIVLIFSFLTACGGSNSKDISTQEGVDSVLVALKEAYPDISTLDLVKIILRGQELEQDIISADLAYIDKKVPYDKLGYTKTKNIYFSTSKINDSRTPSTFIGDRTPIKFDDFDFTSIVKNIDDANKLVVAELESYKLESVYTYTILSPLKEEGATEEHEFTLHYTDSDEGTKIEGKNIVTTYYEFKFIVKNGQIELVE